MYTSVRMRYNPRDLVFSPLFYKAPLTPRTIHAISLAALHGPTGYNRTTYLDNQPPRQSAASSSLGSDALMGQDGRQRPHMVARELTPSCPRAINNTFVLLVSAYQHTAISNIRATSMCSLTTLGKEARVNCLSLAL